MRTKKNFIPQELLLLIEHLKKLPGVGTKTAERFAFELLGWPGGELQEFGALLQEVQKKIPPCPICGCLTDLSSGCRFCVPERDHSVLCLVASARDVYAIEETESYPGLYHVVEHLLSPLDGRHASELRLDRIEGRVKQSGVREIVLAFDSTLEGDTTALFLKQQLEKYNLVISRLAFGMPVGSSLEYIDGGTLLRALTGRQKF